MLLLLLTPLVALLWRAMPSFSSTVWQTPLVGLALQLSLVTASLSTLLTLLIGTPVAYLLARSQSWGLTVIDILIDLPLVLPPAVAGVALLVTFGRNGLIGQYLTPLGIEIPFTTTAVIMAQIFVSAPFYIRAAKVGFAEVDPRLEQISATLGESNFGTFRRVTFPLAGTALLSGAMMCWARALGEFGATILFAGNFPGRTQTMPIAIYSALQSNIDVALALAAILLLISFVLLASLRLLTARLTPPTFTPFYRA